MNDDRLEDVELEVPLGTSESDRRIVPMHLCANHRHGFGLGRVYFAGHNRGAGFVFGELKFGKAGPRS